MSEPNIYENADKYKGKIKYRNLDPELQKMIGNGGSGGGNYDDTEIREQITDIKEDLKEYTDKYADLSTQINNAATEADLLNYRKLAVDITYYDLDSDLKSRLDNISGGGSSGGSSQITQITNDISNLKSKVTINETNIQNNTNDISTLTENFNAFKQKTESDEQQHEQTISSNTNRIEQLEETLSNGINIDISQLPPDISNKIESITTISSDLTALQQQVDANTTNIETNKNNITSNTTNISLFQSNLDNLRDSTNNSIGTINNTINTQQSNIDSINKTLDNLSIDSIIEQNSDSSDENIGKIKETNLNSSIIEKLNKVGDVNNQYNEVTSKLQSLGTLVNGDTGNFIYKAGGTLSTKNIVNFIYIANTTSEVTELKTNGNCYIYDKTEDTLYESTVNEGATSDSNGKYSKDSVSLSPLEYGLQNEKINFLILLDSINSILYFNNNGTLTELINFSSINLGKYWSISVDTTTNSLQIKYEDMCIQEWSINDVNTNSIQSLSLLDNTVLDNTSIINTNISIKILTLLPHSINDIKIDNIDDNIYKVKVLVLDDNENSLTKGLYIENCSICTVAYVENGLKIANNSNKSITIKIFY